MKLRSPPQPQRTSMTLVMRFAQQRQVTSPLGLFSRQAGFVLMSLALVVVCWAGNDLAAQNPPQDDAAESSASQPIDFARDVRPLLATHCYRCHGKDSQESGFRLDRKQDAFAGGYAGEPVIVPGKPEESWLWRRISGNEPDYQMPPEGEPLADKDAEIIRRWIQAGAVWPESADAEKATSSHWSYQPPQRPLLPQIKATSAAGEAAIKNEIDVFIQARLQQAGLLSAPRADRSTLARRVSLALTGLPPSVERLDAYLADQRPDAYERYVDELLDSPAYGERWARVWLDLARYADTQGYEKDNRRVIWRYRDYVIDSFNADKPYDVFTIEQLAGDLLPEPTSEQVLATAFHRNTMTNTEGGTDNEEFRVAAVVDRVNTTMEVWMGTTMGCAQCHTHKYDPITQQEYYEFFAFFNNTEDADIDNDSPKAATPTLDQRDHSAEYKARRGKLAEDLKLVADELKPLVAKADAAQKQEAAKQQAAKQQAADGAAAEGEPKQEAEPLSPAEVARKKELEDSKKQLEGQIAALDARWKPTVTPIFRELRGDKRRQTNILKRGSFLDKGEAVNAGVPEVFNTLPAEAEKDRLALARWLVDRENPLTARVMVNRVWEQLFGIGLVETSEDFGTQGEPPSHPELLDWLSVEFMEQGWSVKQLCRMIVTSATFQQSSDLDPSVTAIDPRNRLLSTGPRFRLSAETIRDQALAVAGLLSDKVGGPSVMPPQPNNVWQTVYSGDTWKTSPGDDKYRRGIYTFWRRTSPHPAMMAFDSGSREFCITRRIRTNTPLQALVTLNDPAYVEAAAALAARAMREGGTMPPERARFAFRACLARQPSDDELWRIVKLQKEQLAHYKEHPQQAAELQGLVSEASRERLDPAEHAAWTVTVNVLMNLDEFFSPR